MILEISMNIRTDYLSFTIKTNNIYATCLLLILFLQIACLKDAE
jgi:hypothetical protein